MKSITRVRVAYVYDHAIEAWLSIAALISGFDFFIENPHYERTPIGVALHPWDYGWNVLYMAGGGLVFAGLYGLRARAEAAGLCLLASAFSIQLLATVAVVGGAAVASEALTALLVAACIGRFWRIAHI